MKLGKLYESAVKLGIENDPRSRKEIQKDIKRVRDDYRKLSVPEKRFFDSERLKHPYADTRILYGNPETEINTIMVGIDMEAPELLIADRLNERGADIDLVISHHPEGGALANLGEVMHLQKNVLEKFGLKQDIAKALMDERIGEVSRSISAVNHMRAVDAARLLDIPYMCMHTPADNHVARYLQQLCDLKKLKTAEDVLKVLYGIPEYKKAIEVGAGPRLISGKLKNNAEKVFVDMTGGTEGSEKIYARLSQMGVGTAIGMHLSEKHFKQAKAEHINVIIAGHIASDNLGLNLIFDNLEKKAKSKLNIINASGFTRIRRNG